MTGGSWSSDQKLRLKKLSIDPVRNPPDRLKGLVNYFRSPGASIFRITDGDGPFRVSKGLARKIRYYVAEGTLDWVLAETPSPNDLGFGAEWQEFLRSHAAEFSLAVEAYKQELVRKMQLAEIGLGRRATMMTRGIRYGPSHRPFVESIFSRDPEMEGLRNEFESALNEGDLAEAEKLSEKIGTGLVGRIVI